MRISNFRREFDGGAVRLLATISWEDRDLPSEDICYRMEGLSPEEVSESPEAFVIRGAFAALHGREKRVLVEGSLCPRLRDGIQTAIRTLKTWYFPEREEPLLEAAGGFRALTPGPQRSALFLSGGSDSLCALRTNRNNFPASHPASFRVAIFMPTFGLRREAFDSPRVVDLLSRQERSIGEIARRAGLRVVSASQVSGELGEDAEFTLRCSHGSQLAAAGHLFTPILGSVSIASGYDAYHSLSPVGTHPLLEPNLGSSAVEIRYEEFGLTRRERIAAVASWEEVLPSLIVCSEGPLERGLLNYGRCEKCLRTMIALLLVDRLRNGGPFPRDGVDAKDLKDLILPRDALSFWEDFPTALRSRGRDDLARTIERLLADARKRLEWFHDSGWKGGLRRFDRRYFGGRLLNARRRLRGGAVKAPTGNEPL